MNKIIRIFMVGMLLSTMACVNDVDLIEEGTSLPLVYGFLDIGEKDQYIRVEKSFASQDESAFVLAKVEDSIYYENLIVRLVDEGSGKTYSLQRVNGADDGYVRDEGDFLRDPNILYKISGSDFDAQGGNKIRLEIDRGEGLPLVTSTTTLLDSMDMISPNKYSASFLVNDRVTSSFVFRIVEGVSVVGLQLVINIQERLISDPTQTEIVQVVWNIDDDFVVNPSLTFNTIKTENINMYNALLGQLESNPNVERSVIDFDLILQGAGEEVSDFRRIAKANRGLTGAQELPNYSNLSEGLGIFSSKFTGNFKGLNFSSMTLDSIANGRFTKDLGFIF